MPREALRYGHKVALYCDSRRGFLVGTSSALVPVGVLDDSEEHPIAFEKAVFTITAADTDSLDATRLRHVGEEVKFGHVVRLIQASQNKVVCYNSKDHGAVDKANNRITLESRLSTTTESLRFDKWRIMPRYQVRGEGERVCHEDHVVFQLSTGEQAFLHVSKVRDEAADDGFEVNGAPIPEGFQVHIYDSELPQRGEDRELRGGECIMLYHREERSFLVANDGAPAVLDPIEEDKTKAMAHVRELGMVNTNLKCSSLFVVEFCDRHRGGILSSGGDHQFRLKSLANGKYLCAKGVKGREEQEQDGGVGDDPSGNLSLTKDLSDNGTLFSFHQAADDQSSHLKDRSRVFVECPFVEGSCWLVAGEPHVSRRSTGSRRQSVRETLVSKARLPKIIRLQGGVSHRDGLEIQRLRATDYQQLNVILSLMPPLTRFLGLPLSQPLDAGLLSQVLQNLTQLTQLCFLVPEDLSPTYESTDSDWDRPSDCAAQRRLLSQDIGDIALNVAKTILTAKDVDVDMLHSPDVVSSADLMLEDEHEKVKYLDVLRVIQQCFDLVRAMVRGEPSHAVRLAEHLEFVVRSVHLDDSVLLCLEEMLRNNKALVDTPDDTDILEYFCRQLLEKGRRAEYVRIIRQLVACDDVGLPQAQQVARQLLIGTSKETVRIFVPFAKTGSDVNVGIPARFLPAIGGGQTPVGLAQSQTSARDDALSMLPVQRLLDSSQSMSGSFTQGVQSPSTFLPFVVEEVLFFADLCRGRNAKSTLAVQNFISKETLLAAIGNETIPCELRAALLRLFTVSEVDVDGSRDLVAELSSLCYITESADNGIDFESESAPLCETGKNLLGIYLDKTKGVMNGGSVSKHMLMDSFLELCHALIRRGAYNFSEYNELTALLVHCLDGRNDNCGSVSQRRADTEETAMITLSKCRLLKMLGLICDIIVARHSFTVVRDYTQAYEVGWFSQILDLDPEARLFEVVPSRKEDDNDPGGLAVHLKGTKVKPPLNPTVAQFFALLVDLVQYENHELSQQATKMFCRLVSFSGEVARCLGRIQLLTSQSSADSYEDARRLSAQLQNLTDSAMTTEGAAEAAEALFGIEQLLSSPLTEGGTMVDKIAMMRHLKLPQMLVELLGTIQIPPRDEFRPFAFQCGAMIRQLSQCDITNQLLCDEVHHLLPLISYEMDILETLRSLYVGRDTVLAIPEEVIAAITSCVASPGSAVAAVLLLQDLLTKKGVGGRYVCRNQHMVWKSLLLDDNARQFIVFKQWWTGKYGRAKRDEVLNNPELYFNPTGPFQLHLEIAKLLYQCSRFNDITKPEEIRHEVFGQYALDDLVEVLLSEDLPFYIRTHYVHLLQTLIIDDERARAQFFQHRRFPVFISMCRDDIADVLTVFTGGQREEEWTTKEAATPPRTPSMHFQGVARPRTAMESFVEASRTSKEHLVEHVTLAVAPCLRHITWYVQQVASSVSLSFFETVTERLNQSVDAMCDVVRYFFNDDEGGVDWRSFDAWKPQKHREKVKAFLKSAVENGYRGTEKWALDVDLAVMKVPLETVDPGRKGTTDDAEFTPRDTSSNKGGECTKDTVGGSLTASYLNFVDQQVMNSPSRHIENIMVSGAGVILRTSVEGCRALKAMYTNLPIILDAHYQSRLMDLLNQVIVTEEGHPFDDSVLYTDSKLSDCPSAAGETEFTFFQTLSQRQDIMASWGGERSPPLLPMVSELMTCGDDRLLRSAVHSAITMLEGGNRAMQTSFLNYVRGRADEEIFIRLRDRLHRFRDDLRQYKHSVLQNKASESERERLLPDRESVRLLLRFIQLLFEGHNDDMQNYFRVQPDNQVSVNVLEAIATLLEIGSFVVDDITSPLIMQTLATITESIQGPCRQNQEMYVGINLGEYLVNLLRSKNAHCNSARRREVQNLAITTLLSLMEGREEISYIGSLVQTIELLVLGEAMDRSAEEYFEARGMTGGSRLLAAGKDALHTLVAGEDTVDEMNDELAVGTNIFIFFKYCLDLQAGHGTQLMGKRGCTLKQGLRTTKSYKFINSKVTMIEIVRNGQLERVYFRIPSISQTNIREESKEKVIKKVNRDSDNSRLLDFFERCNTLILEMEYYDRVRKTPGLSLIHNYSSYLDILAMLVVIATNLFLLATQRAPMDAYSPTGQTVHEEKTLMGLGIIIIILQSLLFIHFFFGPTQVFLAEHWRAWQDSENEEAVQESRRNLSIEPAAIDNHMVDDMLWPQYLAGSIVFLLRFGTFWQRLGYCLFAWLGFFLSPLFYTFILLQVTQRSTQLYNVVLAVTKNGVSLLLTGLLMLIFLYIFGMLTFQYYSQFVNEFEGLGNGFHCDTLLQCFILMVVYGLRSGGGFGENLTKANFYDGSIGWGRLFFDLLFFVILIIILMNIVFGIIVDTFAELREEREFVADDQASKCFICGVKQNEFDRVAPGGFQHHIDFEHNMWHYLFFLHYIKIKPEDDLTGQESHVLEKVAQKEPSFFPVGRSMMLADASKAREAEGSEETVGINEQAVAKAVMEGIQERLDAIQSTVNALQASREMEGGAGERRLHSPQNRMLRSPPNRVLHPPERHRQRDPHASLPPLRLQNLE